MSNKETLRQAEDKARSITLTMNDEEQTLSVRRTDTLLDALRRASYTSVKFGCGTGDCGSCTVLLDGQPVRSCQIRAVQAEGHNVTTVEGLTRNQIFSEKPGFWKGRDKSHRSTTLVAQQIRRASGTGGSVRGAPCRPIGRGDAGRSGLRDLARP